MLRIWVNKAKLERNLFLSLSLSLSVGIPEKPVCLYCTVYLPEVVQVYVWKELSCGAKTDDTPANKTLLCQMIKWDDKLVRKCSDPYLDRTAVSLYFFYMCLNAYCRVKYRNGGRQRPYIKVSLASAYLKLVCK